MNQRQITIPYHLCSNDELTDVERALVAKAKEAAQRAYAPYSGFHVGAAVLLSNGEMVSGSNQENAAYPSGICAERTTLFYANAKYPESSVEALAIVAIHKGEVVPSISPCGACRQVMSEVSYRYGKPYKVILAGKDSSIVLEDNRMLLPFTFSGDDLK
ncbi:MAG: cytidine deaminase [Porphyromonas sp.]|nr:cytidine deaminase [Porphyromonas sp.]